MSSYRWTEEQSSRRDVVVVQLLGKYRPPRSMRPCIDSPWSIRSHFAIHTVSWMVSDHLRGERSSHAPSQPSNGACNHLQCPYFLSPRQFDYDASFKLIHHAAGIRSKAFLTDIVALQNSLYCRLSYFCSFMLSSIRMSATRRLSSITTQTTRRSSTMKEAVVGKGPKVQIIDSPIPKPGPGQIVTKVVYSGSNPKDWFVRRSAAATMSILINDQEASREHA